MVIALTRLFLCVLCVKLISRVTLSDHILAWVMNWCSTSTPLSSHQPALADPCGRHSSASARLRSCCPSPVHLQQVPVLLFTTCAADNEEPLSHSSPSTWQPGLVSLGLCRQHSLLRMAGPCMSFLTHRQRVTQGKHGCQASPLS